MNPARRKRVLTLAGGRLMRSSVSDPAQTRFASMSRAERLK